MSNVSKSTKRTANDPVLEALRKKLREQMNAYTDHMATGNCADYAAYTREAGIIFGLAMAERELLDLDERQGGDPDNED